VTSAFENKLARSDVCFWK